MSEQFWDERFQQETFVYGEEANRFIQEKASLLRGHVGCFAEGEGRNAVYLAEQGHEVTAIDQSGTGLEKTARLAEARGIRVNTKQMDLTAESPGTDVFDSAVLVFGHVPKATQHELLQQMVRSVRAGGVILLEVYSEKQLDYRTGGPPVQELLYAPEDILFWADAHHCLHFYYGEAERYEGAGHHGRCHVIQAAVQVMT
ncbi:class I SAM-dependent methyltransferase [Alkalicoccus chagannorensis]|uniref:class I SAM-dependent methyltransferase n=1 Tax=Alkalicoccus chagannorensis TaxID=427072 RepID=UPI00040C2A31|nr:class I SAM-dependent methyltransferase [Alkalicoccus chagannorensis]